MNEIKCPRCKNPLQNKGMTISGNTKYIIYECDVCSHKELKCKGLLQNV